MILALALISAGITCVFASLQKPIFDVSLSLSVAPQEREQTQDYQYDGYYALQAADIFSDTVASFFQSPENVVEIYKKAELPLPSEDFKILKKIFTAKKIAP